MHHVYGDCVDASTRYPVRGLRCNDARSQSEIWMSMPEYLEKLESDGHKLMLHWPCHASEGVDLASDYAIPALWRGWLFRLEARLNPGWSWIIFGPRGAGLPVHEDMLGTATWNALIRGTKRWTLPDASSASVLQEAGDVFYLPPRVRHSVDYLSACIALSENIVEPSCAASVQTALVSAGQVGLARVIERLSVLYTKGGWK